NRRPCATHRSDRGRRRSSWKGPAQRCGDLAGALRATAAHRTTSGLAASGTRPVRSRPGRAAGRFRRSAATRCAGGPRMHVIATAGHVDHGKSTLIRQLTGMEPDRWEEERRRGLTIDLGFAWARLDDGCCLAFVDVPGHERFVANMLAGVGPAPAVMFVVAADEGWKAQSAEHLAALDALGVQHGVLVISRSDLADPRAAEDQAREQP